MFKAFVSAAFVGAASAIQLHSFAAKAKYTRQDTCDFAENAFNAVRADADKEEAAYLDEFAAAYEAGEEDKVVNMYDAAQVHVLTPLLERAAHEYVTSKGRSQVARGELEEHAYGLTLVKGAAGICHNKFTQDDCQQLKTDTEAALADMHANGKGNGADKFVAAVEAGDLGATTNVFMEEYGYERILQAAGGKKNFNAEAGVQFFVNDLQPVIMKYHYCALSGNKDYPLSKFDHSMVPQA